MWIGVGVEFPDQNNLNSVQSLHGKRQEIRAWLLFQCQENSKFVQESGDMGQNGRKSKSCLRDGRFQNAACHPFKSLNWLR